MEIINLIIFFIIIILLIALSWIWPPNSPWAPWWRTKEKTAQAAFELANVTKKDVIYELGSGEATALLVAAKKFGTRGVGIEIDPIRFYLSKFSIWRKGYNKKIKIVRGDIFKEDISGASLVYVYLVPKTLNKLIPKFKSELKEGTKIISYKYEINLPLKKFDKENDLRLYIV
jgi:predicted RNA methylase